MNLSLRKVALAAGAMLFAGQLMAEPKRPECIAPASPGGGFDLTCKLVQSALVNQKLLSKPMRVTYMPGGVGAVSIEPGATQLQRMPCGASSTASARMRPSSPALEMS